MKGKGREDGGMILCAHRIGGDCMRFYEVDGSGEGEVSREGLMGGEFTRSFFWSRNT